MPRALLLVAVVLAACSDDKKATVAPACTSVDCASTTTPGGTGGGKNDAAVTDTASETATGDGGVAVTALVRLLARFTDDPATGTVVASKVVVQAAKIGGGVVTDVVTADGTHMLTDVAPAIGVPTNFAVLQNGILRANDGVMLPDARTLNLPVFDETLITATWPIVAGAIPLPANSGHLVVHIVDAAGNRLAGVTASTTSADAKGPFYDDGADISTTPKSTNARGTILFMGSTAGSISITLASGAKTYGLTVPLSANAVTHFTATIN